MRRLPALATLLAAFATTPGTWAQTAATPPAATRAASPARGGPVLRMTGEDHDGFGRVAFPARDRDGYVTSQDGDKIVVTYKPARQSFVPAKLPRNFAAIVTGPTRTVITPTPGGVVKLQRTKHGLSIDVLDAPPRPPPPPVEAPPAPVQPVPTVAATPPAPVDPAEKAAAVAAVLEPTATPIQPLEGSVEPAILLRSRATVGLAAFRLGGDMVLVLDAPIAFEGSALVNDPVFGRISAEQTQDATVIRIPLAAPASLRLAHTADGWTATAIASPQPVLGIAPRLVDEPAGHGRLQLPVTLPSSTVVIMDRDTGSPVQVGTQGSVGQGVATERVMVQYTLLPTIQGVAVISRSDDIVLGRESGSFNIVAGPHANGTTITSLEARPAVAPGSTMLSRLFDLTDLPITTLTARLDERVAAAAAAPALSRSAPRQSVAEAMVRMGLGNEAQAVLAMAAEADPAMNGNVETMALRGIAAVVAGRLDEAKILGNPRLSGTAEISLWRGLLAAEQDENSQQAATVLARTAPLLLTYATALRERFLPTALQNMALGGQVDAARKILEKLPDDPAFDLARGMVHEMSGEPDAALQAYAQVAQRGDRLPRYKALVRTVAVKLARGDFGPKEAADALDHVLYAWRGPTEELALRIHMADLRRQTGQWHEAITLLREARAALPEARVQLDGELAGVFTALFAGDAATRMTPSDFVALYDQNTDLLRSAPWSELAGTALVNRLVALDLPGRADPVLTQMVAQSTDPAKRAVLGARLASVRLTANDPAGAIAALSDTAPPHNGTGPALNRDVEQTRQLLYARGESQRGHNDAALNMLGKLNTAEADDLRANLFSARQDWKSVVAALASLEQKRLPAAAGPLTPEQQAIVMRQASAATLAGDQATIDRLRALRGDAMANGPSAEPFRLITSAPVNRTADLPRAFDEIRMARQLPTQLAGRGQP